ncbi:MAG: esterase [Burkholderiales bacterium]|nr:MAG: esterase [Burkholderiales bacterium]
MMNWKQRGRLGLLLWSALVMPVLAADAAGPALPAVDVGRIERLADLPGRGLAPRHVDVWLPEGYTPTRRYHVLYMHDGQNLFDGRLNWTQKAWDVHRAVTRLVRAGRIPDTLIVGIWNSGETRFADYEPQGFLALADEATRREYTEEASLGRVRSDDYLRFIVEELKPVIDRRYATVPGPEGTAIVGSSMGGLISLYALCEYPQVFGAAAGLSTHWVGKPPAWGRERTRNAALPLAAMNYLMRRLPDPATHRVYTDRGDDWLDSLYEPAHRMVEEVLRDRGYGPAQAQLAVVHGTGHSEADWAARIEGVLAFLLSPRR